MAKQYNRYIFIFFILFVSSCRGVVGLTDTPEGVANEFLKNLYQLNFEPLTKIASDQALQQAALLEGHADTFNKEERQRYQHSSVLVTTLIHEEGSQKATAEYTVTYQDGKTENNAIVLEQKENNWHVTRMQKPLITPHIYFYFEE